MGELRHWTLYGASDHADQRRLRRFKDAISKNPSLDEISLLHKLERDSFTAEEQRPRDSVSRNRH